MRRAVTALVVAAAVVTTAGCARAAAPDPQPVSVGTGQRMSVSGDRCPPDDRGRLDVVAATQDRSALLPADFNPSRVLVCEYASTFRTGALVRERVITGEGARELAAAARAIRLVELSGPANCPNDVATTRVLAFESARGRTVDLWWGTSGCQSIDDGVVGTIMLSNPSFWHFEQVFARVTAS